MHDRPFGASYALIISGFGGSHDDFDISDVIDSGQDTVFVSA
jgi:hypothetical protein